MRNFPSRALTIVLLALVLFTMPVYAQDGDSNPNRIDILNQDVNEAASSVEVRVYENGSAVSGLTPENFQILEEHTELLQVTSIETPSAVGVIIDASSLLANEAGRAAEAARAFFSAPANYEDGQSAVIAVRLNNNLDVNVYTTRQDILSRINRIPDLGGGQDNDYADAVNQVAQRLNGLIDEQGEGRIVIIGAYFWNLSDETATRDVAARLNDESGITVSAIHAFTGSRQRWSQAFEEVALAGGGEFAIFGPGTDVAILNPVYRALRGTLPSYQVQYQALPGAAGTRTATLEVVAPNSTVSTTFTYEGPAAPPPPVQIVDPVANAEIVRLQTVRGAEYDVSDYTVRVEVTDMPEVSRSISSARLEVLLNGEIQATIDPQSDDFASGVIEFDWNLRDFVPPEGTNRLVQLVELRAVVNDEFGGTGQAISTVNIVAEITAGGPLPTATEAPSATPQPTETTAVADEDTSETTTDTTNVDDTEADELDAAFQTATAAADLVGLSAEDANATAVAIAGASQDDLSLTATALAGLSPEDINATAVAVANLSEDDIRATQEAAIAAATDAEGGDSSDDTTTIAIVAAVVGAFVILGGLILLFTLRRRRRGPSVPGYGGGQKTQLGGAGGSMKTMVSGAGGATLEIASGSQRGQTIKVSGPEFIIGREQAPGINYATTATYDNVSSRHCAIKQKGIAFFIVDLGSTNGTYLNGQKLQPNVETPLQPNATIQLGHEPNSSIQFKFKVAGAGLGDMGKTRVEVGGSTPAAPNVNPGVWGQKTNLYGNNPGAGAPQPPAAGGVQQAAPGQFFGQQQPPAAPPQAPPPPQQPPPQAPPQQPARGMYDSWANVPTDDDSYLDD